MKKITIEMDDEVFLKIQSSMIARRMTGPLFGNIDGFVGMFIDAVNKGEPVLKLIVKKQKSKKSKKTKRGKKK